MRNLDFTSGLLEATISLFQQLQIVSNSLSINLPPKLTQIFYRYCGKECQEANWTFHKPNCDRRAASKGIGIPVYVTVPIMTSKSELDAIVLKAAEKSIKYKWSEAEEEDDVKEPKIDLYYQLATNSGIVKRDHKELMQEWKNDVDLNEGKGLN